tara:strand:- start:3453 stop:4517 length:1065 start_codon:yes stop_codon:yes gene_type:complete
LIKLIEELRSFFEKQNILSKLEDINKKTQDPTFWENHFEAEKILKKKKNYDQLIDSFQKSKKESTDLYDIYLLAKEENNIQILEETSGKYKKLIESLKKIEIKCFLSNENDILDSYVEFHAGAGGTESQDWAQMLRRMYMRWATNKGYDVELISEHRGDEAGIKSSIIKISGDYIYGYLKSESGIHRLVRISPFDSGARRHTSFASVWVYPVINENIQIEIKDKDIRIDTYRSSGAGGQHVNTTDSAVRITHLPTKIVVQCQNERSQHKNKETCINMLKAKLYKSELQKKEKQAQNIENSKSEIGWGHQIRSYVLHPYRMIKDIRTNYESSNPDKILDGDIDKFLENSLYKLNA